MDGVIVINKPSGITSHGVIQRTRKILELKKIGHTGTLDPIATGVLVLCVGRAARLVRFLQADEKEYFAKMRLGVTTDTHDITGEIQKESECSFTEDEISQAIYKFRGTITQVPPPTSAIKVNGVPMYRLARAGKKVEPCPREVEIKELELLNITNVSKDSITDSAGQVVSFRVACSKGTYIRTLCSDIGKTLGCGATMSSLNRTRSGIFFLTQAITLEELSEHSSANRLNNVFIPMSDALSDYPAVVIKKEAVFPVINGVSLCSGMIKEVQGELKKREAVRVQDEKNNLLAVAQMTREFVSQLSPEEVIARPLCVFPNS